MGHFSVSPPIYPPLRSSSQTKMSKAHPKHVPLTELQFCILLWVSCEPPSRMREKQDRHPKDGTRENDILAGRFAATVPESVPESVPRPRPPLESQTVREKRKHSLYSPTAAALTPPQGKAYGQRVWAERRASVLSPIQNYMAFQNLQNISY